MCATKDKPVAWLCSALRGVGVRDIGLGGYSGFNTLPDSSIQLRYLVGGHSVGVAPERLPGIASFVRTGEPATLDDLVDEQPPLFGLVSRLPRRSQAWWA